MPTHLPARAAGLALLLTACAGSLASLHLAPPSTPGDDAALTEAVEAFYAAPDAASMRQAVERAAQAGPDAPPYHEIAARLALFEDRPHEAAEHLFAALASPTDDAALLHLQLVDEMILTQPELLQWEALLAALAREHPRADVQAAAAYFLIDLCHQRGDDACVTAFQSHLGFPLPLALIGPWDSDQGKGFDAVFPPEQEEPSPSQRYDGALVPVGWRLNPPRDHQNDYTLDSQFTPSRWVAVYGAASVQVASAGRYELRLGASDPLKVWVNGQPVFKVRRVDAKLFDQWVLPVQLRAGVNRILVKVAHDTGSFNLHARITGEGGAPAAGLVSAPLEAPVARGDGPGTPATLEAQVEARVASLPPGSLRRRVHTAEWTQRLVGGSDAVAAAQAVRAKAPQALYVRALHVHSLWANGERDKTAELLGALDRDAGDALPSLRLDRAHFLQQQGLRQQARTLLVGLQRAMPERPGAWTQLASLYEAEGWTEDRCAALEQLNRARPRTRAGQSWLASCWESLRLFDRADAVYQAMLADWPRYSGALLGRAELASKGNELAAAEERTRAFVAAYPTNGSRWLRLADVLRRRGDRAGAEAALEQALKLNPDSPEAWNARASLAYQAGDTALAVERWQAALVRNPDDDKLANRLAVLAPGERGAWAAEIPGDESIDTALAQRASVSPAPGANVIYLLDHEVSRLAPDGSRQSVVTVVAHAVNQEGRDALMAHRLGAGSVRVLRAYAVDASGKRVEASSLRGHEVRFRGLQAGASVVLQYRRDLPAVGYLSRHLSQTWFFQGGTDQRVHSQRILFVPASAQLRESKRGPLVRDESRVGDELRLSWTARDVPPLIAEARMPTLSETAYNLSVSTVPSWDAFVEWEDALLQDAFRESPEVVATAERLFEGVEAPEEKLWRLHTFLMEEIRYQQDYENTIAGVKPHAAPVVLERGYGDCKDKAVLFVTLARRAGLKAEIAYVRTRPQGQVRQDVPSQQFNHAIVYVPPQPGLAEGRFFDPTADLLDVDVLNEDDVGTMALVFDPVTRQHAFREVPFQAPEMKRVHQELSVRVGAEGSGEGALKLSAKGSYGAVLRQLARNPELLQRGSQYFVDAAYPGATLLSKEALEVKDLRQPARFGLTFRVPLLARNEGETLRIKLPSGLTPQVFELAERRYPLVLGAPEVQQRNVEVVLPPGMAVSHLPSSGTVSTRCLLLERKVSAQADRVRIEESITSRCERIPPEEYASHRQEVERMRRMEQEEVVLQPVRR